MSIAGSRLTMPAAALSGIVVLCTVQTWVPASALTDSRRVNPPVVPYALEPLRWGAVTPTGWVLDWALAARHGLTSPTNGPFAHVNNADKNVYHSGNHPIGNDVDGGVDGWLLGRPDANGFWDEVSGIHVTLMEMPTHAHTPTHTHASGVLQKRFTIIAYGSHVHTRTPTTGLSVLDRRHDSPGTCAE